MNRTLHFVPRQRRPLEAVDLGLALAQTHRGPLNRVLGFQLAVALGVFLAFGWKAPNWGLLWLWWISPWLDRGQLHVLSRRVFGQEAGIATFLADWRSVHRGLAGSLLWRRFAPSGAFLLPVVQLEGLSGGRAARRRAVLGKTGTGTAFLLSMATALALPLTFFGVLGLCQAMIPASFHADLLSFDPTPGTPEWYAWVPLALGAGCLLLLEPIHAAGGFALYLNRRSQLEGWDLEQAFHRLRTRLLASLRPLGLLALLLTSTPLLAEGSQPGTPTPQAEVQPGHPQDPARRTVENILATDPDFHRTTRTREWRLRPQPTSKERSWLARFLEWLFSPSTHPTEASRAKTDVPAWWPLLAWLLRALLVVGVVALAVWIILRVSRLRLNRNRPLEEPETVEGVAGLDLRPETLPRNLPAEAMARFDAGDARGALALLYRGALATLVHQEGLSLPASATEGDALRVARSRIGEARWAHLRTLTRAWVRVAYEGTAPTRAAMSDLVEAWPAAFGESR